MTFHQNWIGLFEAMASYLPSARCWWADGIFMAATGLQLSVFNAAIVTTPDALSEERLAHIDDTFDALGLPYSVHLASHVVPPVQDLILSENGYLQMFCDPLMVCIGPMALPAANPAISVEAATSDAEKGVYADLVIQGFDLLPTSANEFLDVLLVMREAHHVVAYLGDEPVGAGTVILAGGCAGVYNVATIHSARRQGVGSAIMGALHHHALASGYTNTALASSTMGLPLYQKLGYQPDGYQIAYMPTDH